MKTAIKKLLQILLSILSNVFSLAKVVVTNTLMYTAIVAVVAALAPFIPFILFVVKYFEYKSLKLELNRKPTPKPIMKPVNKFSYEQPSN